MQEYRIVRSLRKTLALEVTRELEVVVRAPKKISEKRIAAFVSAKEAWILKSMEKISARKMRIPELSEEKKCRLRALANTVLPEKVKKYSEIMGLYPSRVRISSAETRFGSCSAKNSINLSWRLMLYPEEAVDYVVVHELAHIAQKNHSTAFYAVIASVMPDYKERRRLLKQ